MLHIERDAARIADKIEELRILTFCSVSLTMDKHYMRDGSDGINKIERIILSMPDFNGRENWKIVGRDSGGFRDFYRALPVKHYDNDNPNEGAAIFSVLIPDDATIILEADESDLKNKGCPFDRDALQRLADEYGHAWNADEIKVKVEKRTGFFDIYKCTIRFWWD